MDGRRQGLHELSLPGGKVVYVVRTDAEFDQMDAHCTQPETRLAISGTVAAIQGPAIWEDR
jgi:hypothetical protein